MPKEIIEENIDKTYKIPLFSEHIRSINLANAVSVVVMVATTSQVQQQERAIEQRLTRENQLLTRENQRLTREKEQVRLYHHALVQHHHMILRALSIRWHVFDLHDQARGP